MLRPVETWAEVINKPSLSGKAVSEECRTKENKYTFRGTWLGSSLQSNELVLNLETWSLATVSQHMERKP